MGRPVPMMRPKNRKLFIWAEEIGLNEEEQKELDEFMAERIIGFEELIPYYKDQGFGLTVAEANAALRQLIR